MKAQGRPAKIAKVEITHLAGLGFGDVPQRLTRVYGQPPVAGAEEQHLGVGGRVVVKYAKFDGGVLRVNHVEVDRSELDYVRAHIKQACGMATHCTDDPLLDLMGQGQSAAVALLGPPKHREPQSGEAYTLYWSFALASYPAGEASATSNQTLALRFTGGSCSSVAVTW
jgi:hypothetical protein